MSDDKAFDHFVEDQIKKINEFSKYEENLFLIYKNQNTKKNKQFNILDKSWIEKWKKIVGFEKIKDKCQQYVKKQDPIITLLIYIFTLN